MNRPRKLALILLTVVLGGCASNPGTPQNPIDNRGEVNINTILSRLPGSYSNYAYHHDRNSDGPVTDLSIRQLKTDGDQVFLFESESREPGFSQYDIYWLKLNQKSNQAELHFTRLSDDELSLPLQDILSIAWRRVLPGCVIKIAGDDTQLSGQTNPDTCRFEHPLQGETRLIRELSIGEESLTIKTELQGAGSKGPNDVTLLELQKHRTFEAWASIRIEPGQQQGDPGMWQLSQVFNTRDDGRVSQLYDQQMASMGFGLQLARLQRFDGEPAYYKLSIINLNSGQIQAYKWFKPDSARLNLNLDWFQSNLEQKQAVSPQP